MWGNFGELNYRKISLYIKWLEVIPERRTTEEEFNGGTDQNTFYQAERIV